MKINKGTLSYDDILSLSLAAIIGSSPIIYFINNITNAYIGSTSIDSLIGYGIIYLLMFASIVILLRKQKIEGFYFFLVLICILFVSLALHSHTIQYLFTWENTVLPTRLEWILYGVMCAVLVVNIDNLEGALDKLLRISIITNLCSLGNLIFYLRGFIKEWGYMTYSYDMLNTTLIIYYYAVRDKQIGYYIIAIISTLTIFIFGSRGAFLSIIVGLFLITSIFLKKDMKRASYLLITIIITMLLIPNNAIANLFSSVITGTNLKNSRTISMLMAGDILNSTGRNEIQSGLMDQISIIGKGLFADRELTQSIPGMSGGTYAHNFILEILLDFGIIFGVLIVILFYYDSIKVICSKNKTIRIFGRICFPAAIVKLLFTGSYLNIEPGFYIFIGLIIRETVMSNKNWRGLNL